MCHETNDIAYSPVQTVLKGSKLNLKRHFICETHRVEMWNVCGKVRGCMPCTPSNCYTWCCDCACITADNEINFLMCLLWFLFTEPYSTLSVLNWLPTTAGCFAVSQWVQIFLLTVTAQSLHWWGLFKMVSSSLQRNCSREELQWDMIHVIHGWSHEPSWLNMNHHFFITRNKKPKTRLGRFMFQLQISVACVMQLPWGLLTILWKYV